MTKQRAAAPPAQLVVPPRLADNAADKAEVARLIGQIEQERGTRALVYWVTPLARVAEAVCVPLYDLLSKMGRQQRIDVVVFTLGGDTEAPWPIISLLREYADHIGVLVPHRAQSSGTLLALGADEIVMTPLSVLGPIDPTRSHHLLPTKKDAAESEPISVQDMRHAMTFVRTAFGEGVLYTPEAMATILSALFEKIHPLAIGAIEQSYSLAKLIAKQCLGTHMRTPTEVANIEAIANKLCDDFKSHSYEINRREALSLGLKVVNASTTLEAVLNDLYAFYVGRPVLPPNQVPGSPTPAVISWLESRDIAFRVEAQCVLPKDSGGIRWLGDAWKVY
jgi:hypothetical protein